MSSGEADQRARLVSGTCQQVYTALGVFYHTLHGPSWVNQSGWLKPGVPYCSYFGVKCDSAGLPRSMYVPLRPATPPCLSRSYGCLASTLVENKLEGTLDGASLNLSSLVALDISRNNIVGSLPSALAHLVPRLRLLYARGNRLQAPLPAMPATLQHLFLDENVLQGQLDPSVFPTTLQVRQRGWFAAASTADDVETVFVQTLRLGENQFDGTLPVSLARLTRLEVLHLNGNLFEGTVPVEYTELRSLESLLLFDNALSGSAEFLQGYVLRDFPAWLACVGVNSGVAYVCSCLWVQLDAAGEHQILDTDRQFTHGAVASLLECYQSPGSTVACWQRGAIPNHPATRCHAHCCLPFLAHADLWARASHAVPTPIGANSAAVWQFARRKGASRCVVFGTVHILTRVLVLFHSSPP